jgi:[acyl-carrier-protein] S-malonyltransferase
VAKSAWIFPGQGSQYVGMGKDLAEAYASARETFQSANAILGFDLAKICFNGPEDVLKETRYTQLAILVHSVALSRLLSDKVAGPSYVAGHSVGEYSALVAGGSLDFEDALGLVKTRAEAMYAAGLARPGAMAAIMGMPGENLEPLLAAARVAGVIVAANYNSPVQVVLSGEAPAVDEAVKVASSFGAKRAVRLAVSGAFHSPLMKAAEEDLAGALRAARFSKPAVPVVSNVLAHAVTEPSEISALLGRQLTSPVLWHQSMKYMVDAGVESFVEIGPGNVLCGLLKRTAPEARCASCADLKSLEAFLQGVQS